MRWAQTRSEGPGGQGSGGLELAVRPRHVAGRTLSKAEILELYLNSVYLGRGSWGIELAAHSYFGKPAKELTLEEGAVNCRRLRYPQAGFALRLQRMFL
jgi:membrane carboxypeptidase/penicillin-binding protein PbpC